MKVVTLRFVFFITLLFISSSTLSFAQSEWKYDVGIYAWLAGLDGTIGIANREEAFSATAGDLLKNLNFSAGGHFEARNPRLTFIFDLFYAGLGIDASEVTIGDTTFTPNATIDSDEWILEGTFGYRVILELEILFAVRYFILTDAIKQDGNELASTSKDWGAFYLGVRYSREFAKDWYLAFRGDIGYGGDNFAWFANGTVGYRFSKLFSMGLSYRILNMSYDEGSGLDYFNIDASSYGFGLVGVFSF